MTTATAARVAVPTWQLGAVAYLDSIVRLPGTVTRASLRIDPEMDRLRERPDFQRLVSSDH